MQYTLSELVIIIRMFIGYYITKFPPVTSDQHDPSFRLSLIRFLLTAIHLLNTKVIYSLIMPLCN